MPLYTLRCHYVTRWFSAASGIVASVARGANRLGQVKSHIYSHYQRERNLFFTNYL